jgi:FkbM family methyltransferase
VPRLDPVMEVPVVVEPSVKRAPLAQRLGKFASSPRREKFAILVHRFHRIFPKVPIPYRLPFGAWFMLGDGALDRGLLWGCFENTELRFVEKFLAPGMCVLDIGAHHGLYTLLASKRVGSGGKVIAFEPSPRERHLLARNLRLNSASNVHIEPFALGHESSKAELFLVQGEEDGCNSLRPPAVVASTQTVLVDVNSLDDYLEKAEIGRVDFVKLDVEGAEREVLLGAQRLLSVALRPVILAEVQDIRTEPWGYPAREILQILDRAGYDWFRILDDCRLAPIEIHDKHYDANLVAIPRDRVAEVFNRLGQQILGDTHCEKQRASSRG